MLKPRQRIVDESASRLASLFDASEIAKRIIGVRSRLSGSIGRAEVAGAIRLIDSDQAAERVGHASTHLACLISDCCLIRVVARSHNPGGRSRRIPLAEGLDPHDSSQIVLGSARPPIGRGRRSTHRISRYRDAAHLLVDGVAEHAVGQPAVLARLGPDRATELITRRECPQLEVGRAVEIGPDLRLASGVEVTHDGGASLRISYDARSAEGIDGPGP
ncbi:MAG: hypothetical protein EWM72_03449 [Nitrospira sp.]|nr:MAG: hypothetical protein EWM72_03449 [Nitrospira sp.]